MAVSVSPPGLMKPSTAKPWSFWNLWMASNISLRIPDGGLFILRDGDPGEPDVTLNPRTEFYSHRVPIEVITSGDEAALDDLLITVSEALAADETPGCLAEMLVVLEPEVGATPIEGAATIRHATVPLVVEYQVTGALTEE